MLKRSGFVAFAIRAVNVGHRIAQRDVTLHQVTRNFDGLVRRIVQKLDVELVFRIIQLANGFQQPLHHELLIKDRQLHGDTRQLDKFCSWLSSMVLPVLVVEIHHPVAMPAIGRQQDQNKKVGDEQGGVKSVQSIKTFESVIQVMLLDVMSNTLGRK